MAYRGAGIILNPAILILLVHSGRAVGWVYTVHDFSLNRFSHYQNLSQYQTELLFDNFLQSYVLVSNFVSTIASTELYIALNTLATQPTGHWDFAAVADIE